MFDAAADHLMNCLLQLLLCMYGLRPAVGNMHQMLGAVAPAVLPAVCWPVWANECGRLACALTPSGML